MNAPLTWHKVAQPDEVAEGTLLAVEAAGKALVLVNCEGRLSALDERCPHAGAPLSQGAIENGLLVCPWHGREYDLATGACPNGQSIAAYPVEARADGIFVAV